MVIVRDFEKHKYNLPEHGANALSGSSIQAEGPGSSIQAEGPGSSIHGEGIIDTVANFVSQNKDTFKDVSKAVSSVSSASSNIALSYHQNKKIKIILARIIVHVIFN